VCAQVEYFDLSGVSKMNKNAFNYIEVPMAHSCTMNISGKWRESLEAREEQVVV
jgi:hypothetical protein